MSQAALGSLGSAIPGLSGDAVGDVTVTVGVRKDDEQLATIGLEIPAGGEKPLTVELELSKVDVPVTITPPPGRRGEGRARAAEAPVARARRRRAWPWPGPG